MKLYWALASLVLFIAQARTVALKRDNSAQIAHVYAWKAGHGIPYPEEAMLDNLGKTDSALAISGGGLRAYMSTLGYMRGLLDLGLMNTTRYMSAVSGGAWAVTAYTWHSSRKAKSPEHFLGPLFAPEQLTWRNLRHISHGCARKVPVQMDLILRALWNLLDHLDDPLDVWYRTVDEVFLKPVGIKWRSLFSWNRTTVADAIRRNPWLTEYDFVLPCDGEAKCDHRPYPVINSAILGPEEVAPYDVFDLGYTGLETTPLYIGSANPHNFTYRPLNNPLEKETASRHVEMHFGGFVEPFGFGSFPEGVSAEDDDSRVLPGPIFGMGPNETSKLLRVPRPESQFALSNASGASSWAPGSLLAELDVINRALTNFIGLRSGYWSPLSPRRDSPIFSTRVLLADGGALDNQGLCAMLRRKVKNIVVLVTTNIPLQTRENFNPFVRAPRDGDIDSGISALFGYVDVIENPVASVKHNHVFHKIAFPFLVDKLQKAQRRGDGLIAEMKLTTLRNDWWGIEAGHTANIAFVYLGRVRNWELQLPRSLQQLVVPPQDPDDLSKLPTTGPFKDFPHISTAKLSYSPELANLMANLAGWVVKKNSHIFKRLLG